MQVYLIINEKHACPICDKNDNTCELQAYLGFRQLLLPSYLTICDLLLQWRATKFLSILHRFPINVLINRSLYHSALQSAHNVWTLCVTILVLVQFQIWSSISSLKIYQPMSLQCNTSMKHSKHGSQRFVIVRFNPIIHGPLARYVKLAGYACAGHAGDVFPAPRVGDPDMHHGTCVTHLSWYMPGSLTSGFLWSRWRRNKFPLKRKLVSWSLI